MAEEQKDELGTEQNLETAPISPEKNQPRASIWKSWKFGLLVILTLIAVIVRILPDREKYPRGHNVKIYQRTFATALEAYYIDNNCYPAWARGRLGVNNHVPIDSPCYAIPTFRIKQGPDDPLMTLTTPVSYLTSYFPDGFAPEKGVTFGYWVPPSGKGWIVWSAGPDGTYEIDPEKDYDPTGPVPSESLINKTYDPTNGTNSRGDVYRLKQ